MRITREQAARLLNRNSLPAKPRKKPGTGDVSAYKKWACAMAAEPGIFVPIRTVTESNTGGHWAAKARRAEKQRLAAFIACIRPAQALLAKPLPCVRVVFTRYAPGTLDEADNLPSSMKHLRDGLADAFKIDDKSGFYRWEYRQVKTKLGQYGVRIELLPMEGAPHE